jgi:hypothetical protein
VGEGCGEEGVGIHAIEVHTKYVSVLRFQLKDFGPVLVGVAEEKGVKVAFPREASREFSAEAAWLVGRGFFPDDAHVLCWDLRRVGERGFVTSTNERRGHSKRKRGDFEKSPLFFGRMLAFIKPPADRSSGLYIVHCCVPGVTSVGSGSLGKSFCVGKVIRCRDLFAF